MPSTKRCVCGREYKVTPHKLQEPDPDSYQCECGHELFRWKGLYTYSVELIKDVAERRDQCRREDFPKRAEKSRLKPDKSTGLKTGQEGSGGSQRYIKTEGIEASFARESGVKPPHSKGGRTEIAKEQI